VGGLRTRMVGEDATGTAGTWSQYEARGAVSGTEKGGGPLQEKPQGRRRTRIFDGP